MLCVVRFQTVVIAPFSVFGLLFEDMLESLGEGTQAVTLIISLTSSVSFLLGMDQNHSHHKVKVKVKEKAKVSLS